MLLDGQHLFNYQMNDRLQELTVFVRVGESGSFTRAARDMNLSQPSVSRIVGELEARLGVKLLLRTTRRLTLTAAGEKFLDRARAVLADLHEAEDAARELKLKEPMTRGSVVASDAFFPFADGMLACVEAGATAVIQPGGSVRDDEVIKAADEHNIAMVLTGTRHFRH